MGEVKLSISQAIWFKLSFLRDKDIPNFLVRFIDWIRDFLWGRWQKPLTKKERIK